MSAASCTIATKDNYQLSALYYAPIIPLKGIVVLCAAMGVKQSFYKDFAQFMAEQGFGTYTFDYRGMEPSMSNSLKGFSASLSNWAVDIQSVLEFVKTKHQGLPLFAVTHSVGGQLLALTDAAKDWDGVVSVASQSGYWKHWTGKSKWNIILLWYFLIPVFTRLAGYFPAKKLGLFENIPKGVAQQWAYWGRHPLYMKREYPKAYFDELSCPIRAYSFTDDASYGPEAAVDWLHQQFGQATVERKHINPKDLGLKSIGHFNFFRASMQPVFWEGIVSFFENESNKRLIKL